jgi:WD40 repeat protein
VGDGIGGLAVAPDGERVAVGSRFVRRGSEPKTLVLDAASGRELHRLTGGPDVGFHPTSGRLVTGRSGGGAILWDLSAGKAIWNKPLSDVRDPTSGAVAGGRRMALSPDGKLVAIWDRHGAGIQLWNPADGTEVGRFDTRNNFVHALEFSPDSARLVAATPSTLLMWDVASRTVVDWSKEARGVSALAFSPNGQWIATVEHDQIVRLRDAATGREIRSFIGSALRANVLTFSPDSTRLVTGGSDRTVRVWDVESGRELLSLPGVTEAVTGIAWDGPRDRIYALDHAVRVWEAKEK